MYPGTVGDLVGVLVVGSGVGESLLDVGSYVYPGTVGARLGCVLGGSDGDLDGELLESLGEYV